MLKITQDKSYYITKDRVKVKNGIKMEELLCCVCNNIVRDPYNIVRDRYWCELKEEFSC